jgi:hypothetical protein
VGEPSLLIFRKVHLGFKLGTLHSCGGGDLERGVEVGKGVGGWMWCTYCVRMHVNGKMRPIETIPGTG